MTGTIEIVGTGGIIEGNLGSANVNVNLDPIYGNFDGSTSSVNAGSPTMFDDIFNGAGTIMAWIYPKSDGEGNFGRIFDKNQWVFHLKDESSGFVKLNFTHSFSTTTGDWFTTNRVVPLNAWSHVAIVYDGSSVSNDPIFYLNGVAQTLTEDSTPAGTRSSDASSDLYIGANSGGTRVFDGYIMDAKIYKASGISSTQAPIAAAKINQDPDLISPNPPKGWYKFNASTTADSSGNSNTASASNMGSVVYDEFHVDVYDNSTTTDGTFTITQGKVEGLALSSVDLDGAAEYLRVGDNDGLSFGDGSTQEPFTLSAWINMDDATNFKILSKGILNTNGEYNFHVDGSDLLEIVVFDESVDNCQQGRKSTTALTSRQGDWIHVVATSGATTESGTAVRDTMKLYVDGVRVDDDNSGQNASSYDAMENGSAELYIGRFDNNYADGKIKDVKIFNYELSAEQVASLYSNTYPQTAFLHWKLDEGHTTESAVDAAGAFTDTGTKGSLGTNQFNRLDAAGVNLDADSCVNGTLDLDGSGTCLTVSDNGTLSAPRGNLDIADDIVINGTFTHNNGTVRAVSASAESAQINAGTTNKPITFYNLEANTGFIVFRGANVTYTVENILSATTRFAQIRPLDGTISLQLGTTSSAGGLTGNAIQFTSNGTNFAEIKAASSLYPWTAATAPDFDSGGSGSKVRIADCDLDPDITTGGGGVTLTLTGDCEFDAVTVSSGDTLDFNGQRAEFSGLLSNDGNMDIDGALIFAADLNLDSSFDNESGLNAVVMTGATNFDFGDGELTSGTFMINSTGTATMGGVAQGGNLLVGCGTLDMNNLSNTFGDVKIATGGTMTAGSGTLTCSGDFTTSGGLLGASALTFDGTDDQVVIADNNSLDFTTALTMECWVKTTDAEGTFVVKQGGYYRIETKGGKANFLIFTGSNKSVTGTSTVNDGKWHHIAATYDQTNMKIYVDGKLENTLAETGTITTSSTQLILGSELNGTYYTGSLDEIRLFNVAKTEAQIRADMFQGGTLASSTGLVARYKCDEGTGTSLEDSSSNTNTGTLSSAFWAGAGTFTYGTSTLVMAKSGTQTMNIQGGEFVNNLTINDGSTTEVFTINDAGSTINVAGNLIVNEKIKSHASSASNKVTLWTAHTITIGSDVKTTALADMHQIKINNSSGTMSIPECTMKTCVIANSGGTTQATGDLTLTSELEVNGGTTFNANGNTITALTVDVNGNNGTLDLRNSTLKSFASGGDEFHMEQESTLLTGNTTISGFSAAEKTGFVLQTGSTTSREVVGTLENVIVDGDVTVVGSVINCDFANTSSNIRQFHHTLDTQQLLDADEAGDDDLKLEKPALDNAVELQTG